MAAPGADHSPRLVGATLVCPGASELTAELVHALDGRLSLTELAHAPRAYPTFSSALSTAARRLIAE